MLKPTTSEPSSALASGCTASLNQSLKVLASGQLMVAGGLISTFGSSPTDRTRIGAGAPHKPSLIG